MGYKAKSTRGNPSCSPRRKRTVKSAIERLDRGAKLPSVERQHAIMRIQRAKQPVAEARRIVDHWCRNAASVPIEQVDLSDVQEIRANLFRKHGGIWEPHRTMLANLERRVVVGDVMPEDFREVAGRLVTLQPALPKGLAAEERREI